MGQFLILGWGNHDLVGRGKAFAGQLPKLAGKYSANALPSLFGTN